MRYLTLLALLALTTPAVADDPEAVLGRWAGDRSVLEIRRDGDGLSMIIVAMLEPNYREGEGVGVAGEPRIDINNPNPVLQDRPILGLNLVSDYGFEDGQWKGRIYDPESGKVYSSRMRVNDQGELEMRGYIGVPMFGRTAVFVSATSCTANVVTMLDLAGIADVC